MVCISVGLALILAAAFGADGKVYAFGGFTAAAASSETDRLQNIGGFGAAGAPFLAPVLAPTDPVLTPLTPVTTSTLGGVPGTSASHHVVTHQATDAVFAGGTLSDNLGGDLG